MSIHPSLRRGKGKTSATRNVLKRHERIRKMMSQDKWEDSRSIFGLPKIKQERIKARKAAPKETAAAETTDQAAAASPSEPAKSAAKPAKES
jgi:small basic protein (TIGR04137 family)